MHAFTLSRPADLHDASRQAQAADAALIAGGTDLMQLMKGEIETPDRVVDLSTTREAHTLASIEPVPGGIRLGALATMAQVAGSSAVKQGWPMISEALLTAASPQIRNMGTVGGNLLARTRCLYFRSGVGPCNKREPGSGCPANSGENRDLAILGVSADCIASNPSDLPVALAAAGASVQIHGSGVTRSIPLADLYREPGTTPHLDTSLRSGEVIIAVTVPSSQASAHSTYVKIRDRQSFQFAVVSVAVGLHVAGGVIQDARIAFGGVGTVPWRTPQAEAALRGKPPSEALFREAAALCTEGARPASQNEFKAKLMPRVLARALQTLSA